MNRILLAALLFIALTDTCQAWDNICNVAAPYALETTVQIENFAEKLVNRSVEGSGKVMDVKNGRLASKFSVVIYCGNDVVIEVPTNSPRASQNLKIGDMVNFSGLVTGIYRSRFADSRRSYLRVNLNDSSSAW